MPLNTFGAPANGAVILWGWCHPQIALPTAFGTAPGLCLQEQLRVPPAGHQRLVPTAQEKGQGLSICVFLCAASVYFLFFFNPYSLTEDVLVLTRDYLFIKYVQESAPVLAPPSKVGCACPARAEVEGDFSASELGRGGERKGLRGIETSKDVSKYLQVPRQKNISTVLSWG